MSLREVRAPPEIAFSWRPRGPTSALRDIFLCTRPHQSIVVRYARECEVNSHIITDNEVLKK